MKPGMKNYKNTNVSYLNSQSQIMKMLNARDIIDIQFSSISHETALEGGLKMEPDTYAIMLLFQKSEQIGDNKAGKIPVRVIIPNILVGDSRSLNQYYRVLYWYLKTKFEAIDTGLVEFAEEFMAHLQIKDSRGFITRVWDTFKGGYYKALESGNQGGANMLPPMKDDNE